MKLLLSQFQNVDTLSFIWVQNKIIKWKKSPVVRIISSSGDGWLYGVIIVSLIIFDFHKNFNFLITITTSFAIEVPLYLYLKSQFKRSRPQQYLSGFEASITPSDEFSFPSGHTAAAFVMAMHILIYYPSFALFAYFYATAIGLSRVCLGVHFPGDIIAGAVFGSLCGLLSIMIFT